MEQFLRTLCLALTLLIVQHQVSAQPNHGLTVRVLAYNYHNPEPDWKDWTDIFDTRGRGVEIAYNGRLDARTWLVVPFKMGTARGKTPPGGFPARNELLLNLDAHVQFNLFKYESVINPYLLMGVGSTWNADADRFDLNIPAGLGLNVKLLKDLYLNAQTQYRFSMDNRPGWHHGVGATFFFGGAPEVPADRDGDGVPDITDNCPEVPGLASLMGCPDRDGDGIADADDKCPDQAGLAAFMGCPDRDGDGIPDAEDECPDQAGLAAFKGCPDTDGDGIPDHLDKCPREAGIAALQGCPVRDRDGDGTPDDEDMCPDEYGSPLTKGCPDRDGDGVIDREDRCPDKPGPASNKGCPEIKAEDKAKLERAVKLVQFQTGKAVLLQRSFAVLDEVVAVMNQYPEYSLDINGHTDSVGDDKMNQTLSERRAKTCYDYLISKGIPASRMTHQGFGETKPKASNDTAAGREQNRRVEFDLYVK
ncbi:MAG: OmpA family protein [Saprospiraceae bacterium]|nr:OmpA family protein [Saprospiraceae bacterium]